MCHLLTNDAFFMEQYDLTRTIQSRTTSANTQRAYFRWVDQYLVDVAGLKATTGDDRLKRMEDLPLKTFQRHLTPRKLKNWLDNLADEGRSRQTLDQARATIVTLADLLAESEVIDKATSSEIQAISVPSVQKKDTPERLLNPAEIKLIMNAARDMATTPQQMLRNNVVTTMLCTMALRREELSAAKWADLTVKEGGLIALDVPDGFVDIPRPVLTIIDRWRNTIGKPTPQSSVIRRIWKGGRIAKVGLSPDGIWLIIRNASQYAGLGHVTPDDLRRSAVANMYKNGMSIEELSRLLRHRNTLITERFLAKLPLED